MGEETYGGLTIKAWNRLLDTPGAVKEARAVRDFIARTKELEAENTKLETRVGQLQRDLQTKRDQLGEESDKPEKEKGSIS